MVGKSADFSAVLYVDRLLAQAVKQGASDIHIHPRESELYIRFRVDGLLQDIDTVAHADAYQIVARIKVLARLDVSERRLPQDGKYSFDNAGKHIDVRVATFPTLLGEKVVVRILDHSNAAPSLNQIGLSTASYDLFTRLINKPQGFVIITGPTGSGKTTTWYSALQHIYTPQKNIVTLEDPIEYTLTDVTQGQVHPEIGFTFARGIRALLRQDPNIILIGEMRDLETAEIAIQAALTGHFVASTLHTNDAVSVIIRLIDMGIRSFLITACVTGIVAQRLIRRLCQHCKKMAQPSAALRTLAQQHALEITTAYEPVGCKLCAGSGYRGRIGIFEILDVSTIAEKITNRPSYQELYEAALATGMQTLMHDGLTKVRDGITSFTELQRVLG